MKIFCQLQVLIILLVTGSIANGALRETGNIKVSDEEVSEVQLSSIFSDGCVLQRNRDVMVWGVAEPGESLTVKVKEQSKTVVTDNAGNWHVELDPEPAGGPYKLTVSESQSESGISMDVYFGDVWLLTGQSNMNQSIAYQYDNFPEFYSEKVPNSSDDFDDIRFSIVNRRSSDTPESEVVMNVLWNRWEASQLDQMSAVGYFFARSLRDSLDANGLSHLPLGFIKVCRGATGAEQWISASALDTMMKEPLVPRSDRPASIFYNGMIAPIQDYSAKGVLWYQGESNTDDISRIEQYPKVFETLVQSWRKERNNPELPFYYVQLAPFRRYKENPGGKWALMREAQTECLSIPNTAMACIIESGFQANIHPPYKDRVGRRLARIALDHTYDIPVVSRGPVVEHCQVQEDDVILTFDSVAEGLQTKAVDAQPDEAEVADGLPDVSVSSDELAGFALSGSDGDFYRPTEAKIISPNQVLISNPKDVPEPTAVAYAFQNFPRCNLFNSEDLPAEPFRKDICEIDTTCDHEPPSKPENLDIERVTYDSVSLRWKPSTDNQGMSHYELYIDNTLIDTSSDTTYTVTDLIPGNDYIFKILHIFINFTYLKSTTIACSCPYFPTTSNTMPWTAGPPACG